MIINISLRQSARLRVSDNIKMLLILSVILVVSVNLMYLLHIMLSMFVIIWPSRIITIISRCLRVYAITGLYSAIAVFLFAPCF